PVPLPRSPTSAEPTIPRLSDGFVDAAPALPTARASAVDEFRGSITRLWHLLPITTHAKLASGWLARLYREGVEPSGSLQKVSGHPSSSSGLSLAQGKFHRSPSLSHGHSITSSARASRFAGTLRPIKLAACVLMTSSNFVGCARQEALQVSHP